MLRFNQILGIKNSIATRRLISTSGKKYKSFVKWYRSLWTPKIVEPPYKHITQIGDPVLRKVAEPVPLEHAKSPEIRLFIDQMVDVLRKYELVGIAAPQVGISLRIIAMEFDAKLIEKYTPAVYSSRQMEPLPLTILINPVLKVTNYDKVKFVESCGSVKGYSAEVHRCQEVLLTGLSREGKDQSLELKGWNARIAQHEMDHLNGKIYTDIMDKSTFACTCWEAVNSHEGRIEIRFCPK